MMNRALLDDLKARQIAFLEARLVSDAAARQWREHLPAGWAALLATPLGAIADGETLCRALSKIRSDRSREALRPAAEVALAALMTAARDERRRVGDLTPAGARGKLDVILEQPKLIPERLIHEVLESDAMDAVLREVLQATLKEFSEKVNPFFAEWGLPAILKKVAPLGFGIGKGMGSVRAEFERRLDPEISKFLQGFSRTAMRKMSDIIVAKGDGPEFIAMRKHVASWLLDQEVGALVRQLDERRAALSREVALDVTDLLARDEALWQAQNATITAFIAENAERPIDEVLGRFGLRIAPDFDALAAVTWPFVRTMCASAPVRSWLASVVAEFFDSLLDDTGELRTAGD